MFYLRSETWLCTIHMSKMLKQQQIPFSFYSTHFFSSMKACAKSEMQKSNKRSPENKAPMTFLSWQTFVNQNSKSTAIIGDNNSSYLCFGGFPFLATTNQTSYELLAPNLTKNIRHPPSYKIPPKQARLKWGFFDNVAPLVNTKFSQCDTLTNSRCCTCTLVNTGTKTPNMFPTSLQWQLIQFPFLNLHYQSHAITQYIFLKGKTFF